MFSQKLITATFTLASGNFGGGNSSSGNSLTISGLRTSVDMEANSGDGQSILEMIVYGMTLDHMNQLSQCGPNYNKLGRNQISVSAGSEQEGMFKIFDGTIIFAWPDGEDQPNVRMHFHATGTAYEARKPMAPTTRQGAVAGESLLQAIAGQLGWQFENNGVQCTLRNPYWWGTGISQIRQGVEAIGCQWYVDRKTLAIWPSGKARQGVTLISPQTGLVGYPQFDQARIRVRAYYNPSFKPMSQIQVQSSFTAANGIWNTGYLTYELDALMPHGRWFMTMIAVNANAQLGSGDEG